MIALKPRRTMEIKKLRARIKMLEKIYANCKERKEKCRTKAMDMCYYETEIELCRKKIAQLLSQPQPQTF